MSKDLALHTNNLVLIPGIPFGPQSPPRIIPEFRARSNTRCDHKGKRKFLHLVYAFVLTRFTQYLYEIFNL